MLNTRPLVMLIAFTVLALLAPAEGLAAGPAGKEGPAQTCFDGVDNDGDGLIDLDDPDCEGKGGDGDPAPPDNIRARFSDTYPGASAAAVKGDGVACNDGTEFFDYVNPNDAGCVTSPPIDRSNLSTEGVWWLGIKGGEARLEDSGEIVVDRWAVMDFTGALVPGSDQNYTGSIELDSNGCPDLDAAYDNDGIADGGPAVVHQGYVPGCVDHVVLSIRTERAVDLFSLPEGEIVLEHFRINVPGPPTQSGSRLWRPLYSFSYGVWEKETVDANTIIIRTTADENGDHLAALIEEGKGPVSKRIVGTYNLPVEITLKRVAVP